MGKLSDYAVLHPEEAEMFDHMLGRDADPRIPVCGKKQNRMASLPLRIMQRLISRRR